MDVPLKVGDKIIWTRDTPNTDYWDCMATVTGIHSNKKELEIMYRMEKHYHNTHFTGIASPAYIRKLTKLELALK